MIFSHIRLFFVKLISTIILIDTWELQDFSFDYMKAELRFVWKLSVIKADIQDNNKLQVDR